jgi:biopolymer transport protein ExbD
MIDWGPYDDIVPFIAVLLIGVLVFFVGMYLKRRGQ